MLLRSAVNFAAKPFVLLALVWTTLALQPSAGWAAAGADDAQAIVEKADRVRFPREDFEIDVRIRSDAVGQAVQERQYRILSKGVEQTLVSTLEPAADRGHTMLLKGRDLWIFMPSISQPIRLPLAQRLTGQVAYGDLARANFTEDYSATLVRTEPVSGKDHYVLELTAVDGGVTYHRVVYWVEKGTYRPHKAEFYTLSGRRLKTCRYEDFKPIGGEVRPTRLVLEDALRGEERSVLEYSNLQVRELPEKYFTKDYLKKLAP
jgi:outer membrane lipoprotein-sorting protein